LTAPNKKQVSKIHKQKSALRASLWPDLDEKRLWAYKTTGGWLNIPRAMPLLLRIMDTMSKGKPISQTYLDLWCRTAMRSRARGWRSIGLSIVPFGRSGAPHTKAR